MDLLKTILLYLTMVFVSSVQMAPEPSLVPETPTPAPAEVVMTASITPTPTPSPTPVPTPNITPNNAYKTLKVGDRGDEVRQMQRRLAELGYYDGEIDGAFGNQSRRAVERFQYQNGLSVDGIAGKRTLTVLYESDEVVTAPLEATPSPANLPADTPTAAITTPPASDTPAPTFVPSPTPSPTITALPTVEITPTPTVVAATSEPMPAALTEQTLKLAGTETALTETAFIGSQTSDDSDLPLLHPLQVGEQVYVPLLEILRHAEIVTIAGVDDARQENAFSILEDVYQLSYEIDDEGIVKDILLLKNMVPQVMTPRSAYAVNNILYLPLNAVTDVMQITFTLDEAQTQYTITMPVAGDS